MEIGKPEKEVLIEPAEDPVPAKVPEETPVKAPPEKVPA